MLEKLLDCVEDMVKFLTRLTGLTGYEATFKSCSSCKSCQKSNPEKYFVTHDIPDMRLSEKW